MLILVLPFQIKDDFFGEQSEFNYILKMAAFRLISFRKSLKIPTSSVFVTSLVLLLKAIKLLKKSNESFLIGKK